MGRRRTRRARLQPVRARRLLRRLLVPAFAVFVLVLVVPSISERRLHLARVVRSAGAHDISQSRAGADPAAAGRAGAGRVVDPAAAGRAATGRSGAGRAATGRSGAGRAATGRSGAGRAALPLAGRIVGIDPGHNGRNYADPAYIDHLVWNGREEEACDTTGTETDGGYTEAEFNFDVASALAADLRAEGAKVVMTRNSNDGVGPCVNRRARILDAAHVEVAIDVHADGGPPSGRGFAVLEPVADGPNDRVISASKRFGGDVARRYGHLTGMPRSDYDGTNGISFRGNLAGLNLTTVPKVLIECGNMRNAIDASRLVRSSFQRLAAKALAEAITEYLR